MQSPPFSTCYITFKNFQSILVFFFCFFFCFVFFFIMIYCIIGHCVWPSECWHQIYTSLAINKKYFPIFHTNIVLMRLLLVQKSQTFFEGWGSCYHNHTKELSFDFGGASKSGCQYNKSVIALNRLLVCSFRLGPLDLDKTWHHAYCIGIAGMVVALPL